MEEKTREEQEILVIEEAQDLEAAPMSCCWGAYAPYRSV